MIRVTIQPQKFTAILNEYRIDAVLDHSCGSRVCIGGVEIICEETVAEIEAAIVRAKAES